MKPKNKIKLHKSVIEAINSAIELVNSMIELHKLKQKPIPEYKKGAKEGGLMIIGQGSAEKETIVRPDGKEVLLKGKPIIFQSDIEKGVICSQEDWSKKLNEYLKEKGLNDSQPFGFAPIEDKEPKVDFDNLSMSEFNKKSNDLIDWVTDTKKPIAPPLGFNHDFHKQAVEAEKELDRVCKPKKECEHYRRKIDNWYEHYSSINLPSTTTIVCLDCGENLTLKKRQEMKNRQIEIGKEIEKLRIEARTIKNQLKDSN